MSLLTRHTHPLLVDCAVARWTLVTAVLAPTSLVAAWFVAGFVQHGHYDPISQTISVLAERSASDRWIMTVGLYMLGACQILTAAGLSVGRRPARILLAAGGLTGLGVAAFPQSSHGSANTHLIFATASVSLLAIWPATIGVRGPSRPLVLSVRGSLIVTAVFVGLLAWLYAAAHGGGALGVAERVDTAIANSWPLVVVIAIRHRQGRLSTAQRQDDHERPSRLRRRTHPLSQA
jgi:hypothetical membrane protein